MSAFATTPADSGKLLVLTPGLGAVSTTFMAGVEAVRRGLAAPIGSLSQMQTIRIGPRSEGRNPFIRDLMDLAPLESLEFGAWDVFPDNAYEAAVRANVLRPEHLSGVKEYLSTIKPMAAAFDQKYVKRLDGPNVKKAANKFELAEMLRADIRNRMAEVGAERKHLAVHGASPCVKGGHQRGLAHVFSQSRPQNGRPPMLLRCTRRCQSGCRTAGKLHSGGSQPCKGIQR